MNKKDSWKQETPGMQLKALLGSILGDVDNIRDGTTPGSKLDFKLADVQNKLDEAMVLCAWMRDSWDVEDI